MRVQLCGEAFAVGDDDGAAGAVGASNIHDDSVAARAQDGERPAEVALPLKACQVLTAHGQADLGGWRVSADLLHDGVHLGTDTEVFVRQSARSP
ncbi:hypothetical protein GCM10010140_40400 [Streptosporangium pseudovulgare]|uniref:Uncharacterized protein n=1 Tax=Streptosporangium pseudovulgare TaxID=35765 RepID=A0ABQ2R1C9_9ACTN|nr:hypothetical protein GCM10010140_40400 [Streptosporangium pseudovulgare]